MTRYFFNKAVSNRRDISPNEFNRLGLSTNIRDLKDFIERLKPDTYYSKIRDRLAFKVGNFQVFEIHKEGITVTENVSNRITLYPYIVR